MDDTSTIRTAQEQARLDAICDEADAKDRASLAPAAGSVLDPRFAAIIAESEAYNHAIDAAAAELKVPADRVRAWASFLEMRGREFRDLLEQPDWRDQLRARLERYRAEWDWKVDRAIAGAMRGGPRAFGEIGYDGVRACVHDPKLLEWAEAYDGETGAVLLGPTGIGKSAALALVTGRLVTRQWRRSRSEAVSRGSGSMYFAQPTHPCLVWVRALDLGVALQRHPLGEGEPEILATAKAAPLLLIDDLGWEVRPDAVLEVLAHRYDAGGVTCITSGFTWEALVAKYGEAVIRRPLDAGGRKGKLINCHPRGAKG